VRPNHLEKEGRDKGSILERLDKGELRITISTG